jgi:alpha-glucosidase
MLLMTLRGTPTTYYGEELGMENISLEQHQLQDPYAIQNPDIAHIVGRDPERSPMQWDQSPNAGFCSPNVTPWLPTHTNAETVNVAVQEKQPESMLSFYKHLTELRKTELALCLGDFVPLTVGDDAVKSVFCYVRRPAKKDVEELARQNVSEPSSYLVLLNFTASPLQLDIVKNNHFLFDKYAATAKIKISTCMQLLGNTQDLCEVHLKPNEGLVLELAHLVTLDGHC